MAGLLSRRIFGRSDFGLARYETKLRPALADIAGYIAGSEFVQDFHSGRNTVAAAEGRTMCLHDALRSLSVLPLWIRQKASGRGALSIHPNPGDQPIPLPDFDRMRAAEGIALVQGRDIVATLKIVAFQDLEAIIENIDSIVHLRLLLSERERGQCFVYCPRGLSIAEALNVIQQRRETIRSIVPLI